MQNRLGVRSLKEALYLFYFVSAFAVLAYGSYYFVKRVTFQKPEKCNICHYMAPSYRKWTTSTHNKVPCLKCHDYTPMDSVASQIKFLAGTYTYNPRPITSVPDANCLQSECHSKRLIESRVTFTEREILFDHKPHFTELRKGIKLHCRSCHSDIVQGEHVRVSTKVCFLCHFMGTHRGEAFPGCGTCHSAPKEEVAHDGRLFRHSTALQKGHSCDECHLEVESGTGNVAKEKCYFCHVEKTEAYVNVDFVHRQHVSSKQIDCLFCHEIITHGKIRMLEDVEKVDEKKEVRL